jgi:BON domain-containing protein
MRLSYGTERAAAETAASGLIGVRNVRNDIDISYVIDPVGVDLHVQDALGRSALVPDGSDVKTDTKDGIIMLTGHVRTWAEHDAVVVAAQMALGSSTFATTSRSPAEAASGWPARIGLHGRGAPCHAPAARGRAWPRPPGERVLVVR